MSYSQREKVYPAMDKSLWGLINDKGQWVIPPQYHKNIYWPDTHSLFFYVKQYKQDKSLGAVILFNQFGDSVRTFKNEQIYSKIRARGFEYELLVNEALHGKAYRDSLQERQKKIIAFKNQEKSKLYLSHSSHHQPWGKTNFSEYGYSTPLFKFGHQDSLSYFEPIYKYHLILFNQGAVIRDVIEIDRLLFENPHKKGRWGIMDSSGNILIPALAASPTDIQLHTKYHNESRKDLEIISLVTTASKELRLKVYNASLQPVFDAPILNSNIAHERHEFNNNALNVLMASQKDSGKMILAMDKNGHILDTFNSMKSTPGPIKVFRKNGTWQVYDLSFGYKMIYQFADNFQDIELIGNKLLLTKHNELTVINLGTHPYEIKRFSILNSGYKVFKEQPYIGFILNDSLLIQSIETGNKQMLPGNKLIFSDQKHYLTEGKKVYDTMGNYVGHTHYLTNKEGKTVFSTISKSAYFQYSPKYMYSRQFPRNRSKHIYFGSRFFCISLSKPAFKFGDSLLLFANEYQSKIKVLDSSYNLIDSENEITDFQLGEWFSIQIDNRSFLFNDESKLVASRRTTYKWIKNYNLTLNGDINLFDSTFRVFKTHFGNTYLIDPKNGRIYKLSDEAGKYRFSIYNGVLRFKKKDEWFYVNHNFEIFYKTEGCSKITIKPIGLKRFRREFKRPFWY